MATHAAAPVLKCLVMGNKFVEAKWPQFHLMGGLKLHGDVWSQLEMVS